MKITDHCYPCLGRLVRQATELATGDPQLRSKAIENVDIGKQDWRRSRVLLCESSARKDQGADKSS